MSDENDELKAQVANLEAQIYTLKAQIKSAQALQNLNPDSMETWEIMSFLSNWADFEVPSETETETENPEDEYASEALEKYNRELREQFESGDNGTKSA